MYEFFEHTADLGLRIRAQDLDTLFAEAGQALFAAMIENPEAIGATESLALTIDGTDHVDLLFDWLRELLYRFDAEHRALSRFDVHCSDTGLTATVWGERLDWSRHVPNHEVKAITYHGLKVEHTPDGWLAEVIVDI
jgi:SHS2 domain-containing protein